MPTANCHDVSGNTWCSKNLLPKVAVIHYGYGVVSQTGSAGKVQIILVFAYDNV